MIKATPYSIKLEKRLILIFAIVCFFFTTFASADQSAKTTLIIKKLENRFSDMAGTKKIGAMSLDSINTFFESIIKKIPAIETLMRINSNGVVINEISSQNTTTHLRNVSEQKWFNYIKTSKLPYYGSNRDSSGNTNFFWAWPICGDDSSFSGAISAKIKPSEIVKMATSGVSSPVKISFNGSTIYKFNWSDNTPVTDDTITLAKHNIIVVSSVASSPVNSSHDPSASTKANISAADTINSSHQASQKSDIKNDSNQQISQSSPPVYTSDLLETTIPKRSNNTLFVISGIVLLIVIIFLLLIRNKLKKKNELVEMSSAIESTPQIASDEHVEILAISDTLQKENPQSDVSEITPIPEQKKVDTTASSDAHLEYEDETKELHVKKVIGKAITPIDINKDNPTLKNPGNPLEQKLRREIYREIHNQIMQWIVCESARLSGLIDDLNNRLNKIEDGNNPGLEQIKHETLQISKEIELFKTHLTEPTED